MKYYWINIDKRTDRKEFMENEFKKYNLDNVRISAETPETISKYEIFVNTKINFSQNELSCSLSHIKAIKQGYDDGDDYFIITEDDIHIPNINIEKILQMIKEIEKKDDETIDILQLHVISCNEISKMFRENINKSGNSKFIIKRDFFAASAAMYLVSRKGAKKIIERTIKGNNEIDLTDYEEVIADYLIYKFLNTYVLTYPILLTNTKLGSDIHMSHIGGHCAANNLIQMIWYQNNQLDLLLL